MSPRNVSDPLIRECPVLRTENSVLEAVRLALEHELPALPVQGADGRICGVFGEREFFSALFPGYLNQLHSAKFVTRSLNEALEKRSACALEHVGVHMTTDHVDVGPDFSDAEIAETFLHHRVLIVPVVDDGTVRGVITRRDFFRAVAERFLETTSEQPG